jgi:TatA/E family protein of Tat protein translocase
VFNVGSQELIIVLFVVLMLFGSKRIPEVARSFGKGVKDFRKAMAGLENELKVDLDLEDKPRPPAPKLGAPEGTTPVTRSRAKEAVLPTTEPNESGDPASASTSVPTISATPAESAEPKSGEADPT